MQSTTEKILEQLQGYGITQCYMIAPRVAVSDKLIRYFWKMLHEADTLKYRFPDVENMDVDEACAYSARHPEQYFVFDTETGMIVAEFVLENRMAKCAQIHFCMHPGNSPEVSLYIGEQVTATILTNWPAAHDFQGSYLDTLLGLIPAANRVSCIFVLKCGFTKLGQLPSSAIYFGEVVDSMVAVRTAEDIQYG